MRFTGAARGERRHTQQPPQTVNSRRHMVVAVGVDPTDHSHLLFWHNDSALLRAHRTGRGTTGRDGGQCTHGAEHKAPIKSHPPDRLVRVPDKSQSDRSNSRHTASEASGQDHTRREHTPIMSAKPQHVPSMRTAVQQLMRSIEWISPREQRAFPATAQPSRLSRGTYPEKVVEDGALSVMGVIDLLEVTEDGAEIADFKSGSASSIGHCTVRAA